MKRWNVAAVIVFIYTAASSILAASGDLDTTFGNSGKATSSVNAVGEIPNELAVQTDGKILITGNGFTGTGIDFVVARFNSDGTLDNSFGTGGIARISFGDIVSAATDIALQSDGKIVVVGLASSGFGADIKFAVARFNADGSLDASFGTGGKITTSFDGNLIEAAFGVAIQPDGKIIAAGSQQNEATGESQFAVARYNPNGTLDSSFDGDGRLIFKAGTANETVNLAQDVALQNDGKIILVGEIDNGADSDFAVVRLNPNGSFDQTFDGDGKVRTTFFNDNESAYAVAIQTDGKLLVAGFADVEPSSTGSFDFAVARYNADGSLDTNFSGDGKTTVSFGANFNTEQAFGIALQANGKILVAGQSGISGDEIVSSDFAVARLNAGGEIDMTFGTDGKVKTSFDSSINSAYGISVQSDGKIVVGGTSGDNDPDTQEAKLALARYIGDNTISNGNRNFFDFDGDGKSDISVFRPSNGEWWYSRSSNNQVVAAQFGASNDKIAPADFTGDGRADIAFWRPATGEWFVLKSEDGSYYSFPFGTAGDVPVTGDFDADGKADAAVFRPSNLNWFIQKSSGGISIVQFGAAGDVPIVGDYDGDGKSDIAIFRPSSGQWWLNRSTAGVIATTFGIGTDKLVPGDYTGDGKTDIAVWRPASGEWFILRSENDSYYSFAFGRNGDVPAPGDYDGDAKFDAAVFRPEGSTWFVQNSAQGTLILNFGTTGDFPVPNAFVP